MTTTWTAVYKDGTRLRQYNVADGTENLFRDIEQDRLFEFQLNHNKKTISLFIGTGTFGINGFLYNTDISYIKDCDYRLVNFVRHQKVIGAGSMERDRTMYFMGFQVNIDDRNHKRFIQFENDTIKFVDE